MKSKIILACIVSLGFLLRIINLENLPPGFFADEASIGYNAYSILTTGKDEHGYAHPLFFKAFGEYKSPIQTYSTIPFIAIFGLTQQSVRLVSALYGSLTIIALYLLTTTLFPRSVWSALMAQTVSFFLAISPWYIHLSRVSLEGLTAYVFFTTLATYFFLRHRFIYSYAFFALALYSYFPARIFIPFYVLTLTILYIKTVNWKKLLSGFFLFSILSVPLIFHLISGEGLARFQQVSIFAQKDLSFSKKIDHVVANYFAHFSPTFLFVKGDIDFPGQFITRHSVRGIGELYSWQAPFILLGLFYFLIKLLRKQLPSPLKIIIPWLLFYPLGSAITSDSGPQATRSIIGVIPFQILTAFGLFYSFKLFNITIGAARFLLFGIGAIIIVSLFTFAKLYWHQYPTYAADYWGWQYGPREIVNYFENIQREYDELVMSGEFNAPYIFFRFYSPNNCIKCRIGNLTSYHPEVRQLFALKPTEITIPRSRIHVLDYIYYPNGETAFEIFTIQ